MCRLGLARSVEYIFEEFPNVICNQQLDNDVPLLAAARNNHAQTVSTLLGHPQVDINAHNVMGPAAEAAVLLLWSKLSRNASR